jgi:signal transduction histidine kinase
MVAWSFAVAAGALVATLVAALVSGEAPGRGSWALAPVLAAGVGAAVVAAPARRLGDRTARRLDVRRPIPVDVARSLASERLDDPESIERLCESLLRAYRLESAEVWSHRGSGRLERVASVPARGPATRQVDTQTIRAASVGGVSGRAWVQMWSPDLADGSDIEIRVVPAVHAGGLQAVVVLGRRQGERFSSADDRSLSELGGRLGVLLHNRELDAALQATLDDLRDTNDQLRASRIRLVSTADAERRRIERDLHDGAQQHLAAVAVNLGLARQSIIADPSTAPELLDQLGVEVREAIAQLRALAHGIYPPLLISSGLIEALRAAADRSPSPVTVKADGFDRYAPEVEAAVYFCCVEAIHNSAKHAPGASVRVTLRGSPGGLAFSVEDDGPGIDPERAGSGHGMVNMSDRIGAVGGTLVVGPAPSGGALIEGTVPVQGGR